MNAVEYALIVVVVFAVIGTLAFAGHRLESSATKPRPYVKLVSGDFVIDDEAKTAASPFGELPVKTDWYPADLKPVHIGAYEVRMPLTSVEMINMAEWDGKKWCDPVNGRECYFQQVEWRGIKVESLAVSTKLAHAYRAGSPLGLIELI